MRKLEVLFFMIGAGLVIYSLVKPDSSAVLQIMGVASLMIAVYFLSRKVESKKKENDNPSNENE